MANESLQKYIPSKTYVDYLNKIGHRFTDFETAAILYHTIPQVQLKFEVLSQLAENTDDAELKRQIKAKILRDKSDIDKFTVSSGDAVFVVECYNDEFDEHELVCYTTSFETAWKSGVATGCKFKVEKHRLLDEIPKEKKQEVAYFNPYIARSIDWEINEENVEKIVEESIIAEPGFSGSRSFDESLGTFYYDKEGNLLNYYVSYEDNESEGVSLNKAKDVIEDMFSNKLFYNAFVEMPSPFELGDFVRYVNGADEFETHKDSLVGIVSESRENYEAFLHRAKTIYVDFSDAQLTVTFINKDGKFEHNHISPILLEKVEPDKDADRFDLAMNAKWMICGEGSLDFFTHAYEAYK